MTLVFSACELANAKLREGYFVTHRILRSLPAIAHLTSAADFSKFLQYKFMVRSFL
jgi:hypothetical protein